MTPQPLANGQETGTRTHIKRLFCAANSNRGARAELKPGPFDAAEFREGNANHPVHALVTGLLVIYPVLASVAVVLAGMWLLGVSHPA